MALTARDVREVTFRTALRGYAIDEVDDFLDLLAEAFDDLEQGRHPRLTVDDVERQTFSTAIRGYDLDEVDDFLDRAVATMDGSRGRSLSVPGSEPVIIEGVVLRADRPVSVKGSAVTWVWFGGYLVVLGGLLWGLAINPVIDLPAGVRATVIESAALTAIPILATVLTLRREVRSSARRAHTLSRLWRRIGIGMIIFGLLALLAATVGIDLGLFEVPSPFALIITGGVLTGFAAHTRSRQRQGHRTSPILIRDPSLTAYSAGLLEARATVMNTGSEILRDPVIEPFRFVKQWSVLSGSSPAVAELRPGAEVSYRATIGPVTDPELWKTAIEETSWGFLATYRDDSGRQWEQLFYP